MSEINLVMMTIAVLEDIYLAGLLTQRWSCSNPRLMSDILHQWLGTQMPSTIYIQKSGHVNDKQSNTVGQFSADFAKFQAEKFQ